MSTHTFGSDVESDDFGIDLTDVCPDIQEPAVINFDGSQSTGKSISAIGYVITDDNGVELERDAHEIDFTTSVQTEFNALLVALRRAKALGLNHLKIEGDCSSVIELARGDVSTSKPELQYLQSQVRKMLLRFKSHEFKHVRREENKDADKMAHTALDAADEKRK